MGQRARKTPAEMIAAATAVAASNERLVTFLYRDGPAAVYRVGSRTTPGAAYRVHAIGERLVCSCPAAAHVACWHRAGVAIRRAERRAHGLAPDAAAPIAPAPRFLAPLADLFS